MCSFLVNCPSISSWLAEHLISIIKTSKYGQITSIICTHLNTNLDQISIKAFVKLRYFEYQTSKLDRKILKNVVVFEYFPPKTIAIMFIYIGQDF